MSAMQAHQSNRSQGWGSLRPLQLRTQSPPLGTVAEAPGCLWSVSDHMRPYATISDLQHVCRIFPGHFVAHFVRPKFQSASDHIRPYATISDLQHVCPVRTPIFPGYFVAHFVRLPNPKSKIQNPKFQSASDHMRPYPTFSMVPAWSSCFGHPSFPDTLSHTLSGSQIPNPQIQNSRAHPTICDHMRPYPTFSILARVQRSQSPVNQKSKTKNQKF
jgi:hypothetical protein